MTCLTARPSTPHKQRSRCHFVGSTRDEILDSWHNQHVVTDDSLWFFSRGHPLGSEDGEDRNELYYARVKRDRDLNYQLALLLPVPTWLTWKVAGRIEEVGTRSYTLKLEVGDDFEYV